MLQDFPTPVRLLEKGVEGIVGRWKQDKLRAVGIKRAKGLIEAARLSVGVRAGIMAAENDLINLLENYELQMRQYERTMIMVEQLVKQIPGLNEMVKIKGVGLITAAGFIAEVGDISRFEPSHQILG